MAFEFLNLEIDHRLALVRLDRPTARNGLSQGLMCELPLCAREVAERTDVDVPILTGGEARFSAGADL
jgi:enoyl-CoA hydratase